MTWHDFEDEWYGWRLRGRHLVSPDGQRISRTRLVKVVMVDLDEYRRHFGKGAG